MKNVDPGYPIPDPYDPADYACFRVYVPRDTLYLGAFWTAYEYFTSWIAWARDPFKTGKKVAAIWRSGYDRARQEYLLTKGECQMNITGIRQNPLNPCEVQIEFDGNNQWQTALDLSKCGGGCGGGSSDVLRFNGTTIQRYDPCSGQWSDAGTNYNPAYDGAVASALVGYSNAACVAAANIAEAVNDGKVKMTTVVSDFSSIGQMALGALEWFFNLYGLGAVYDIAGGFLEVCYAYLSVHYAEVGAVDLATLLPPIISTYFSNDGTITAANLDRLLARIDPTGVIPTDQPEFTAYSYAYAWIKAAGTSGLATLNHYAHIDDYDCSAAEWEYVFDFSLTSQGFLTRPKDIGTPGLYDIGHGWRGENRTDGASYNVRQMYIARVFEPATITHVSVYFDFTVGNFDSDVPHLDLWRDYPATLNLFEYSPSTANDQIKSWDGSETFTALTLLTESGHVHTPGGVGAADELVKKIVVRGTGFNPFA